MKVAIEETLSALQQGFAIAFFSLNPIRLAAALRYRIPSVV